MGEERKTDKVAVLPDGTPNCLAGIQLTADENAAYAEAAQRAGVDVHAWARSVLNEAAERVRP